MINSKTDLMFEFQEGQISDAETMKLRLEQRQRERRAEMESREEAHEAKWFQRKKEEGGGSGVGGGWDFKGDYWRTRERPGFRRAQDLAGAHRLW